MADFDIIDEVIVEQSEEDRFIDDRTATTSDPVLIRGSGNFTLFGLSNKFDTTFPPVLIGKARHHLAKAIDWENSRLYLKLGLRWRLEKCRSDMTSLAEYVLMIEFVRRVPINRPD